MCKEHNRDVPYLLTVAVPINICPKIWLIFTASSLQGPDVQTCDATIGYLGEVVEQV